MASNNRAPKQWTLTTDETLTSFTNWKENMIYTLSLDTSFAPFLKDGVTWKEDDEDSPHRGFEDDATGATNRKTKEEKCTALHLMLGQIANWATIISRNDIVTRSTSLGDIWNKLRQYYGFHTTGSRFLDLGTIRFQPGERAEALYQRLISFIDDNLLTKDCGVTHHGSAVKKNESVSPSLENVVVYLWLERLHVSLPALVKQKYGAELRNRSLASIKPEISQALSSMLEELSSGENSRIARFQPNDTRKRYSQPRNGGNDFSSRSGGKFCCLCRTANRPSYDSHNLAQCRYLPEKDRKAMRTDPSNIRNVEAYDNYVNYDNSDTEEFEGNGSTAHYQIQHGGEASINNANNNNNDNRLFIDPPPATTRRVTTRRSPKMHCFYGHFPITLLLDSGAEANLIGEPTVISMGLRYSKTAQGAQQVDMKTPLPILGEITGVKITKGANVFTLDALVTKDNIGDIVAGEPFLELNDVAIRPAKHQIIVQGREIIPFAAL